MSRLLSEVSEPVVIALDAQWGAGKTIFLKMWAGQLRNAGLPVVHFDAFANDYSDDAFSSIAAQIVQLAQAAKKSQKSAVSKFTNTAISVGKVLVRSGVRTGVKIATLNSIDTKDAEEAVKILAEELGGIADKAVSEIIQRYDRDKEKFEKFREALSELPALLSPPGGDKRPMVIIVDELDRCRPIYALEVLEKIKHFFSVPNVHFVLGVHMGQLRNSVKAAYGSDIDANLYLQKFIQFNVVLSDGSQPLQDKSLTKFVTYLAEAMEFDVKNSSVKSAATNMLIHIAEARGLGFRTIERIFSSIAACLMFKKENYFIPEPILVGLCIIKVVDPPLFMQAKFGTLDYQAAADSLALVSSTDVEEGEWKWSLNWWKFCLGQSTEDGFEEHIKRSIPPGLRTRERIIPYTANELVDALNVYAG